MSHDAYSFDDDDDEKRGKAGEKGQFREFDCPSCNANNPTEPFSDGDELHCHYCGGHYLVKLSDEGKLRLKEL